MLPSVDKLSVAPKYSSCSVSRKSLADTCVQPAKDDEDIAAVGASVERLVGVVVVRGTLVGLFVIGATVGLVVTGGCVGLLVGSLVGDAEGDFVGIDVGLLVG